MKIGIVGLGLIGGSLGFDLVAQGHEVMGVSRQPETCQKAVDQGAATSAQSNLSHLTNADVVFICTPIATIEGVLRAIVPYLKPKTIVTDVGSVKAPVVDAASHHWPRFVGGHPMAGKIEVGFSAAEPGLFRQRAYVLTPTGQTPADAIETIATLVRDLQARLYTCSPTLHDRAVAWISHLPVMVSSSLLQVCNEDPDPEVRWLAQQFASSGFQDTSRVGGGPPELGVMMARYNRTEVLRCLEHYQIQLKQLTDLIEQEDWQGFQHYLETTQAVRPAFVEPES